jgi:hypothetical protein
VEVTLKLALLDGMNFYCIKLVNFEVAASITLNNKSGATEKYVIPHNGNFQGNCKKKSQDYKWTVTKTAKVAQVRNRDSGLQERCQQ